ncbi:MAG: phosphotransferase [Caldilineaceae bacterium]|nr:phosphotransferase [Caldilineaceae bacterium]
MTAPLQPTMLWEATDPTTALTKRFQFTNTEAATAWLRAMLAQHYGVKLLAVTRLTISAYNLIAWTTTDAGSRLVKCCADLPAHAQLQTRGELVHWLGQQGLPVSAPLVAQSGSVQVQCEHLSVGVQRVIAGALLDPTQIEQSQAAGLTLAQLHQALAAYPQANAVTVTTPVSPLAARLIEWANETRKTLTDTALRATLEVLVEQAKTLAGTSLVPQLIHGDYRAANVLWQEDKIAAVLDFEEVRWGYRVNDLAWAAVHLGTRYHHWGPVSPAVHRTFLDSYTALCPLTEQEMQWLLPLLTWHSLTLAHSAVGGPTYATCLNVVSFYRQMI